MMKNKDIETWKREQLECFTSCLELFDRNTREYRQLVRCIDELRRI